MKTAKTNAIALALLLLPGCLHQPAIPRQAQDNTEALSRHPEFPAAARAAPHFVTAAFEIITRLETESANRE